MTRVRGEAEAPLLIEWRGGGTFGEMRFTEAYRAYGPELQLGTLLMLASYAMAMMLSRTRVEAGAGERAQQEVWRVMAESIRTQAMELLEKELLAGEAER